MGRLFHAREFELAVDEGTRILESNPGDPAYGPVRRFVGSAYAALGRDEAAYRSFTELRRGQGRDTTATERAYQRGGFRAFAAEMLSELRQNARAVPYGLASWSCLAGEPESALVELSRAPPGFPGMPIIGTWPGLDCVRSDPRFQELLRKINWPGLDD